jgi:hypothetical protein
VTGEEKDWRLTGQERYLRGVVLVWKPYRARSDRWEHDHCSFCRAKFMDPTFSKTARRVIEEHPDVLTEGYTTTVSHEQGADYHWVCKQCCEDFSGLFEWRIEQSG